MGEGRKEPQSGRSGERKALHAKRGRDSPLPPLKTFLPRVGNSDFFLFDSPSAVPLTGFSAPPPAERGYQEVGGGLTLLTPFGRGEGNILDSRRVGNKALTEEKQ